MKKLIVIVLFLVLTLTIPENTHGYSDWQSLPAVLSSHGVFLGALFSGSFGSVVSEASFLSETKAVYGEEPEPDNIQRLLIEDNDIRVEIFLNKTYHSGDSIKVDFYITNKGETFDSIDIKLEVYYFGIKVFSYEHPSWREYPSGKTVHIFYESKLPMVTPPGKYTLKFYLTPADMTTKKANTSILVKPSWKWFLLVLGSILTLAAVGLLVGRYWKVVSDAYRKLSLSQKMIFLAVVILILSVIPLMLGLENYANAVPLVAYWLLLVGVLNMWVDLIKPHRNSDEARGIASIYMLFILMYMSKETLTVYPAVIAFIVGGYYLFQILQEKWGTGGDVS